MKLNLTVPIIALLTFACASPITTDERARIVEANAAVRTPLFEALAALEGDWVLADEEGNSTPWEFKVTSAGTAVQETMMRGTEHEMTNLYTLEGDGIAMVHYCASGNQPRMRATTMDGNSLAFGFQQVFDLKRADEVFMGEMTLVFVDDNTVEQHWKGIRIDEQEADHETVMRLTRK